MLIGTTFTHVVSRQNELVGPPTFKKTADECWSRVHGEGRKPERVESRNIEGF